jgi:SAM-dependent methyltransferase
MTTVNEVKPGGGLNWNAISHDYAEHRPTYPISFFNLIQLTGVGKQGQHILDIGAGTGALAIQFAKQGSKVTAIDASEGQLIELKKKADELHLDIDTKFARAEETGLPSHSFDAITASMCWGYLDKDSIAIEVPRLLKPNGVLLVSSLIWTHDDPISQVTDSLIAEYNPASKRQSRSERSDPVPDWVKPPFSIRGFYSWTEGLSFTREGWRGRIRATKWIGAALDSESVVSFDKRHDEALKKITGDTFTIPHQITFHLVDVNN